MHGRFGPSGCIGKRLGFKLCQQDLSAEEMATRQCFPCNANPHSVCIVDRVVVYIQTAAFLEAVVADPGHQAAHLPTSLPT